MYFAKITLPLPQDDTRDGDRRESECRRHDARAEADDREGPASTGRPLGQESEDRQSVATR